jgi:SulP family sulfate permease
VLSGATSRWAAIFAGVWIGVIIIVFTDVVAYIAMPTLAALLMIASASTIKPIDVETVWETGWPSRAAIITTFIATLLLPIQVAVGLGVALSAILYLAEASTDVSVVELVERDDGRIEERKAPKQLESDRVTVLDVYGHLFFAGARALGRLLPEPNGAENPAVILRMRGRANVGATLLEVLAGYVDDLSNVNGRLYMSGLSPEARDQIARSEKLSLNGPVRLFEATSIRGDSTRLALEQAEAWIVRANQ